MNTDAFESGYFPGYYHVPENERLLINIDAKVIDLRTMSSVLESTANNDYRIINVIGQGSVHIHRLMAMVFLKPPLKSRPMQVNHINGNKLDCTPSNLEWVTPGGNLTHAMSEGLRSDSKAVLCKDLTTGAVTRFYSQSECGFWFKVPADVISAYIRNRSIYPFNGKYELVLEKDDWRNLGKCKVVKMEVSDRSVFAISKDSTILFDSPHAAGDYLDIPISYVFRALHAGDIEKTKGWDFKLRTEFEITDYTYIAGRPHKNSPSKVPRPVVITDQESGHITEWNDLTEFSYVVGYRKNTIQKSMLLNNSRWRQYHITYKVHLGSNAQDENSPNCG